ncbi:unnamed protein product [Discosporangium mesarthrocarpum]
MVWGVGVSNALLLALGYAATQALKCCCCVDSVQAEHGVCVHLLQVFGGVSLVQGVSDLLSLGGLLAMSDYLGVNGVPLSSRCNAMVLLTLAALVHGLTVCHCCLSMVFFREGQSFLSAIGLGKFVLHHNISSAAAAGETASPQAAYYRGGGRALGTIASNRGATATTAPSYANGGPREDVRYSRISSSGPVTPGRSGTLAGEPPVAAAAVMEAVPLMLADGSGRGAGDWRNPGGVPAAVNV